MGYLIKLFFVCFLNISMLRALTKEWNNLYPYSFIENRYNAIFTLSIQTDRCANYADPDQMPHNVPPDQGLLFCHSSSSFLTYQHVLRCQILRVNMVTRNSRDYLNVHFLGPTVQNVTKLIANVTLKFLFWNMANTLIFFAEKMQVAFALQSNSEGKNFQRTLHLLT